MKALNLLTLGVAALAAMTLNLSAGQSLQSPRAKANDAKIVTAATDYNTAANTRPIGVSPRAFANQTAVVKGAVDSTATAKCRVIGSPKHLAASQTARACCCGTATAACPMSGTCCAMN